MFSFNVLDWDCLNIVEANDSSISSWDELILIWRFTIFVRLEAETHKQNDPKV